MSWIYEKGWEEIVQWKYIYVHENDDFKWCCVCTYSLLYTNSSDFWVDALTCVVDNA